MFDWITDLHDDEVVKPLEGYPGYYITNYGRVHASGPGLGKKGRWLRPSRNRHTSGYRWWVTLKRKPQVVHRLVAKHFLPEWHPLLYVCHKDESLTDHRSYHVDNLFVGTASDNMQDMVNKGRHRNQWTRTRHD